MPDTWNPAGSPKVRPAGDEPPNRPDDRVSLAPLSPETVLRALLATPPEASQKSRPQD